MRIYNALAHGVRLRILRQLITRDACCCKDIVSTVDLAQSTVSQHLKVLVEAGLVDYRPERQSSRYSVNPQALAAIRSHLRELADYKQVQEKCDAVFPGKTGTVFPADLRQNNA
ncbi:ArsR/SmtB family transcription factor [Brucella sp. IR073]|uniref:ArsR/SmtB family transcription factor n=1 Tax=unclassified Brucella TaxID=2632610 RepID=UPI003B98545C